MRSWRISELRQCLGFVRVCRDTLRSGDLPRFFRYYGMALRSLNLARSFGGATAVTATAGLSRILADLGDLFENALRPAPRVEAWELVPHLYESLKVLQRRGVDVEDEALLDRARNQATVMHGSYRIVALDNSSTSDQPSADLIGTIGN